MQEMRNKQEGEKKKNIKVRKEIVKGRGINRDRKRQKYK
jgi:hypothetical protein